jgi:hypothetical protein
VHGRPKAKKKYVSEDKDWIDKCEGEKKERERERERE